MNGQIITTNNVDMTYILLDAQVLDTDGVWVLVSGLEKVAQTTATDPLVIEDLIEVRGHLGVLTPFGTIAPPPNSDHGFLLMSGPLPSGTAPDVQVAGRDSVMCVFVKARKPVAGVTPVTVLMTVDGSNRR